MNRISNSNFLKHSKRRLFFIFWMLWGVFKSYCQPSFVIDTVFLEKENIKKITSSTDGDIWAINDSMNRIYYFDSFLNHVIDKTNEFSEIINFKITDIASAGKNKLLIGTDQNFAYYYDNGNLYHIDTISGLTPLEKHINSVFYNKGVYGISTNIKAYSTSNLFSNLSSNFFSYEGDSNITFLSGSNTFVYSTKNISSQAVFYKDKIRIIRFFSTNSLDDTIFSSETYYMSGSFYAYTGSNMGLVYRQGSWDFNFLNDTSVYDIIQFNDKDMLFATEYGIFRSPKVSRSAPVKVDLGIANLKVYSIVNHNYCLFAATNLGVIKIVNSDCYSFFTQIDVQTKYANIQKGEEIQLSSYCPSCTNKWIWDMGDGNVLSTSDVSYKYQNTGNYIVTLIESNEYCQDSASTLITVYSDSILTDNVLLKNNTVPFDDSSSRAGWISVCDINNDNRLDIFIPYRGLFIQNNTDSLSFNNIWDVDKSSAFGSIWGDLNNDGYNELITSSGFLINKGHNIFVHDNNQDIFMSPIYNVSLRLIDFNNDGLLDIISAGDYGSYIYENLGDFRFRKVDSPLSTIIADNATHIDWNDFDNDSLMELVFFRYNSYDPTNAVKNIVLEYNPESKLFSIDTSCFLSKRNGYYSVVADINNDKRPDFFFSDWASNSLFINTDEGYKQNTLTQLTNDFKVENFRLSEPYYTPDNYYPLVPYSACFADLNNDGNLDFVKTRDDFERKVFINKGNLCFIEDTSSGLDNYRISIVEEVISADINNDGGMDIMLGTGDFYNNHFYTPDYLWINNTTNKWLKFKLFGTKSNANAIGATVSILNQSVWQTRQITAYNGRYGQGGFEIHFGVGQSELVDSVIIKWPSGHVTSLNKLSANNTYTIVEPFLRLIGDSVSCDYDSVSFSLPNDQGINYQWFRNDTLISGLSTGAWKIKMSGIYKCLISQYNQLFDTTNEIYVKINPAPVSVIEFENNDIFCPGDSIKILSTNYPLHSYSWFKNNVSIFTADSSALVIHDAATYYLVLKNKFNCVDTSNLLKSKLFPKPPLNLGEDKTICEGDSVLLSNNNSTYNYLWNTGDTQNEIVIKTPGRYFLDIIDENGCRNSDTLTLQVNQNPNIEIGPDTTITFFDCIELYNYYHKSSVNYLWNNSFPGYSFYFCGNYSNQFQDHLISVIASDELGCVSKDSIAIKVVFKINENGEPLNTPVLFPNVTSSRDVFLFLPEIYLNSDSKVEIYSNNGELLDVIHLSDKSPSILYLNLNSFSNGVFYFAISNKTSRIIKELSLIP